MQPHAGMSACKLVGGAQMRDLGGRKGLMLHVPGLMVDALHLSNTDLLQRCDVVWARR